MKDCFCAFCKRPRSVSLKKHLSWPDVLALGVLSLILTVVFWREANPKGILIFIMGAILTEMAINLRWRMGLVCAACGFDPLLYVKSPELASKKVRAYYDRKRSKPDFLLTSQSLIETQKRIQTARREQARQQSRTV